MAEANCQAKWLLMAVSTSWICSALSGKSIDPLSIIPPQCRPPKPPERKRSAEEQAAESKRGWAMVDKFFNSQAKSKKKGPGKKIVQKIVLHKE